MSKIIGGNTIMYPRAMAKQSVPVPSQSLNDSLIKLRNTSVTFSAVFASQWHPQHAVDAEILLVIFPKAE